MSHNLFEKLLSLQGQGYSIRAEDFFTEIVAWLFDNHKEVMTAWLKTFLNIENNFSSFSVETQVHLPKLEEQSVHSRPDIFISLQDGIEKDHIMIESKIGITEHDHQLRRYAEQLAEKYPDARTRHLVYITRMYDPKNGKELTKDILPPVKFWQFRWYEFHNFLKKQPETLIIKEIMEFMRSKNMAEITRITPASLAAISLFPDVYEFFNTALDGYVMGKFNEIFKTNLKKASAEYPDRRHVLALYKAKWVFLLGFWMPEESEQFPIIAAHFYVEPHEINSCIRMVECFKKIESDSANSQYCWKGFDFDKPTDYPHIELSCSFGEIVAEDDHISAIQKRLLTYLDKAQELLENYSTIFLD